MWFLAPRRRYLIQFISTFMSSVSAIDSLRKATLEVAKCTKSLLVIVGTIFDNSDEYRVRLQVRLFKYIGLSV